MGDDFLKFQAIKNIFERFFQKNNDKNSIYFDTNFVAIFSQKGLKFTLLFAVF